MTEHGVGKDWDFHALPEAKRDGRPGTTRPSPWSWPGQKGEALGTWVIPSWAGDPDAHRRA